jgi:hypothetical protein
MTKKIKEGKAFVYMQRCIDNGRYYVGYHKGTETDGYFCSSRSFELWRDHDTGMTFERSILFRGTKEECKAEETKLLSGCFMDKMCYNMSNGDGGFLIRTKMVGIEVATKRLIEADTIPKDYRNKDFIWYSKDRYVSLGYRGIKEDLKMSKTLLGRFKLGFIQILRRTLDR